MKVLLVNGSPREKGNTATALGEIAAQLHKNGIDTETLWIGNKPVRGCIACGRCKASGAGRCIFDDDICNRISERFADADALIVGSPSTTASPTAPCCPSSSAPSSPTETRSQASRQQPSPSAAGAARRPVSKPSTSPSR